MKPLMPRLTLTLVSLLFLTTSSIFAQRMTMQPCFGLDQADCDLYYDLQMAGLPESTAFEASFDIDIDIDGDQLSLVIDASGAYVLDMMRIDTALDNFGALGLLDVSPRDVLVLLEELVSSFNAELSFDLNRIPGIMDLTGGQPLPPISLWLVDGIAYADLTLIANFLMGDPSSAGVYGVDVFEIVNSLLADVTLADLIPSDTDMDGFGMMTPQDAFMQGFGEGFNQGFMMGATLTEDQMNELVNIVRLDDEELDGATIAVFEATLNLNAFVTSDFFRPQIMQILEAEPLPADVTSDQLFDAINTALSDSTFVVTERYDLDTLHLLSLEALADVIINPEPFAQLDPQGFSGDEQPLRFTFGFNFQRNSINAVEAIELPEGSQIVPLDMPSDMSTQS